MTTSEIRQLTAARPTPALARTGAAIGPALVIPVVGIAVWAVTAIVIANPAYPSPAQVAVKLVELFGRASFMASLGETVWVTALAFATALAVGVIVGCLCGAVPLVGRFGAPLLYLVNSTPKVTIYPTFLLLMGLTVLTQYTFGAFHGMFIAAITMMEAVRGLDPRYHRIASALGMGFAQRARLVILPALAPYLAVASRLCFALTFLGVIVAQLLAGHGGLGGEILLRIDTFQIADTVAIVAVVFLIAVVPTVAIRSIEGRFARRAADPTGKPRNLRRPA